MTLALSVLDLVPVRAGQTSAQAVASSLSLAETADALDYRRYWFAEHHNIPAVASTAPPVLIAATAARTSRIRVGSGGVMLPNHAPLVVAEQFAALEALAPGRIDLGIGRAPGSDPVITQLLRQQGTTSDVERFPEHVGDILSLVSAEGAALRFASGGTYDVHATPAAESVPEVWLLGSSDYSARLAAQLGLPYVFANHFSGQGLDQALALYRSGFRPTPQHPEPRTFITANVVAAPTADEADARALPQVRLMARLRSGMPLTPLETVEEAAEHEKRNHLGASMIDHARATWFIGSGDDVASRLDAFARAHDVGEIMLSPVAGAFEAEPLENSPGRVQTLTLVAEAVARLGEPAAV